MSSSPLKWFRKNQKWLIVVATAFLMFVFTLSMGSDGIDPLIDIFTGGSASDRRNPVAVSWNGGELRESQLTQLRQERSYLRNTLNAIFMQLQQRQGQPLTRPLDLDTTDAGILEMVLSTKAAEDYGMQVTDDIALEYLDRLGGNGVVKRSEMLTLWRNITNGRGTESQLLYFLRRELAMQRLQGLVYTGGGATSPLQMWDLYNQLERKMDAELLGFNVEDYVDQVAEPSEAELRSYFEAHKDLHQQPGRPTPGFKLRERLAFDYIEFSYDDYLAKELAMITDEEVREFYEENKESFLDTSLPSSDLDLGGDANELPAAEVESNFAEEGMEGEAPATDTSDDGDTESDPASTDAMPPKDDPPESGTDSSDAESSDATMEEGEGDDSDGDDEGPGNAETPEDAETDDDDGLIPTLTPVPQEGEAASDAADDDAPLSLSPATPEAETETEKKYLPLEEVTDQIREEIAAPRVRENMDRAILKAQARMDSYYGKYLAWEQQGKEAGEAPPALPTFDDLGDEGIELKVNSIPLADRFEVMRMEGLGSSVDFRFDGRRVQQAFFVDIAFGNNMRMFQGQSFPGASSKTRYVYWVTDRKEPQVQTFEEARDQVVKAWKLEQARDLALAAAEKAAGEAEGQEGPLSEVLAADGRQFFRTGEITYMTGGSVDLAGGGQARLSQIPGVDMAGAEMLRGLFRMKPGDVGVVWNAPKSTVYVAKAISSSPSLELRQDMFLTGGTSTPGMMSLVRRDRQEMLVAWYEDLQRSKQVKWDREPRIAGQR